MRRQFEGDLNVWRNLLQARADEACPQASVLAHLGDDPGRIVRRDREAEARVAALLTSKDRPVDADHPALRVEEGAARIAAIDRGVGLDKVIDPRLIDVAVQGTDDADADRVAQT